MTVRPDARILYMGFTDDAIVRHGMLDEDFLHAKTFFAGATRIQNTRTAGRIESKGNCRVVCICFISFLQSADCFAVALSREVGRGNRLILFKARLKLEAGRGRSSQAIASEPNEAYPAKIRRTRSIA